MTEFPELRYDKGALDDDQIQELADHFWRELISNPQAQNDLGIQLSSDDRISPFEVTANKQGIGVGGFVLGVAIHVTGRLTYEALVEVWRKYIIPRLKSRAIDSIGDEKKY